MRRLNRRRHMKLLPYSVSQSLLHKFPHVMAGSEREGARGRQADSTFSVLITPLSQNGKNSGVVEVLGSVNVPIEASVSPSAQRGK